MFQKCMAVAAALALAGAVSAEAAGPVRIGYSLPRTGPYSTSATSQDAGYQLWRDKVNAAGGLNVNGVRRPVEFVIYDDQSDPSKAVSIYEKLITDDKVDLVFAPWGTAHHFAIVGLVERYKMPLMGNTVSSVRLREMKPKYFWVPGAQPDDLAAMLVGLMKSQGIKTAAVLTLQLPFSLETREALLPGLKSAGIEAVVAKDYPPTTKDMTALLAAVQQAKPDAVITLSYPPDSVLYMNQARELGITAPFQCELIGPSIPFFRKMFGPNADGIVTLGAWTPHKKDWTRSAPFYEAYKKKYNDEPDYSITAVAYESCEIVEQAVERVGLDREKLREEYSTGRFDSIMGPVEFKGRVQGSLPTTVSQIQDGQIHFVWPPEIATSKFKPKGAWAKN
jgi:branched-chain amino acid transport system substrate-binding protein